MSKLTDVLTAMREAGGARELLTAQWVDVAQKHDGLRSALGKRMPTPQKLGLWLTGHLGATVGELTLHGRHSLRKKAWRYAVLTSAEAAECERRAAKAAAEADTRARAKAEAAGERIRIRTEQKKARLAAEGVNRAVARELTRKRLASMGVKWTPPEDPHAPPAQRDYVVTGVSSDGAPKREFLPPAPTQSSGATFEGCTLYEVKHIPGAKVETWKRPDGSLFENVVTLTPAPGEWQPAGIHGRPTRAELAARHHQYEAAADIPAPRSTGLPMSGLSGPSGVRVDTSGHESWMNRLWLKDF